MSKSCKSRVDNICMNYLKISGVSPCVFCLFMLCWTDPDETVVTQNDGDSNGQIVEVSFPPQDE